MDPRLATPPPDAEVRTSPDGDIPAFLSPSQIATSVQPELFSEMTPERVRRWIGVPRAIRKARYPELYAARMSEGLIDDWARGQRPPDHARIAFEEVVLEDGDVRDGQPPRFRMVLHGFLKRWCVVEWVRDPKGPGYKMVSIAQEPAKEGVLPPDLDPFFHGHLTGKVGEHRAFHRRDFELIRAAGDRRQPVAVLEQELDREDVETQAEADYANEQALEQTLEHMWKAVHHAANGGEVRVAHMSNGEVEVRLKGSKQWSFPGEKQYRQPRQVEEKYAQHERNGYIITTRVGGRFDLALRAEAEAAAREASREECFEELDQLARAAEKKEAQIAKDAELRRLARAAVGQRQKGRTL